MHYLYYFRYINVIVTITLFMCFSINPVVIAYEVENYNNTNTTHIEKLDQQKKFSMFYSWNYSNSLSANQMQELGFNPRKLKVSYQFELFGKRQRDNNYENPSPEYLKYELIPKWLTEDRSLFDDLHLDVEVPSWLIDPSREKDERKRLGNIEKFITIISTLRKNLPKSINISFYNVSTTVQTKFLQRTLTSEELQAWQIANDKLEPLTDQLDMILPSLYTEEGYTFEMWRRKASYVLSESKRVGRGKPVYAYISPQYMNNIKKSVDPILWRKELEYLLQNDDCDGVLLWMDIAKYHSLIWDSEAAWWKETIDFISEHKSILVNKTAN